MSLYELFDQLSEIAIMRSEEHFDDTLRRFPADVRADMTDYEIKMARAWFRIGYSVGLGEGSAFEKVLNKKHAEMQ